MARKMPKLNKEILQKISDLVPRQYLGFWEVSILVLWHDPKLHSFSGIKSQSTWPGQALSTSTMCNHIWRDTPMYNFYMYMLRFTYLYTLIQISFYKSLVDDSIANSKDDSRSKLPAVSDTKMLQEHFERCYSSVQWQSGMRPIKQSDAMPWCCILRHWLRADFQEDREYIEWNNQTYFGCKGIHFMDFLLSSNIWHEMIWYDMMCYDIYIYIYIFIGKIQLMCSHLCIVYIQFFVWRAYLSISIIWPLTCLWGTAETRHGQCICEETSFGRSDFFSTYVKVKLIDCWVELYHGVFRCIWFKSFTFLMFLHSRTIHWSP